MDTYDIREMLESEYDIPFIVQSGMDGGEPCYVIGPKNSGKELFTVKIYFRNHVRLHMDVQPEKYSAHFIQNMAGQDAESRSRFISYTRLLNEKGAKSEIRVNCAELDLDRPELWPDSWYDFHIHITKIPIFEHGESYPEEAYNWGSILIGMVLSLADIVPIDSENTTAFGYTEGDVYRAETNRYERNPLNRKLCLIARGYDCAICGMNFEKTYGSIGKNFIHVHHVIPVSQLGPGYVIDPMNDLIPVCPNCHAMLHRKEPPFFPEELIACIKEKDRTK